MHVDLPSDGSMLALDSVRCKRVMISTAVIGITIYCHSRAAHCPVEVPSRLSVPFVPFVNLTFDVQGWTAEATKNNALVVAHIDYTAYMTCFKHLVAPSLGYLKCFRSEDLQSRTKFKRCYFLRDTYPSVHDLPCGEDWFTSASACFKLHKAFTSAPTISHESVHCAKHSTCNDGCLQR